MKMQLNKTMATLAASLLVAAGAIAQEYPNKPVKIVVGYVPGGGPDTLARLLASKLTQSLGQAFVIENKAGASATLATAQVAKSAPDGYTLLLAETAQLEIAPHVFKSLPYDSVKSFKPIAMLATGPIVLISNAKTTQIKTLQDLIREAKANPGKINYGSVGIGSIHHIAIEVIKNDLGINLTHVPYKGGAQALPALLSGEVPLIYTSISTLGQHTARVNMLAVSSNQRFPSIPDVPSVGEFIQGYDFSSQMGVLGPAGLPQDVVDKLTKAIKLAVESPEYLERLKTMGFIPTWTTPEGYAEKIRENLKKYERAVKLANIQPE